MVENIRKAFVPSIIEIGEIKVIGLKCLTSNSDNKTNRTVAKLWENLSLRLSELHDQTPARRIGAMTFPPVFTPGTSEFTYFAGFEAKEDDPVPSGMATEMIPGGKYAVFTHKGAVSGIDAIYEFYNNEWLPQSGYAGTGGIEFEVYDERFTGFEDRESEIDVYFPIR